MEAKRGARRQRNGRPSDCRGGVRRAGTRGDHEPALRSAELPPDSHSFVSYQVSNGLDGTLPLLAKVPPSSLPSAFIAARNGNWPLSAERALPFRGSSHTATLNVTDCIDRPRRCIRTTATVSDQVEICDNDNAAAPDGQRFIQGERMGETSGATQTARAQDEFFC